MRAPAWLDLLYPRVCGGCGQALGTEAHHLCWECRAELILVRPPFCNQCGDPVEGRVDSEFICFTCSRHTIYFDRARSAARYDRVLRQALQQFKYHGALWLGHDLLDLLEACYQTQYGGQVIDAICYVPMHARKRRERGYNQAQRLAEALGTRIRKPLLRGAITRVRPTVSQTNLTARERMSNVKGAFRASRRAAIAGRRLLLVDDIMTTGATCNEGSRVLRDAGASKVFVLTVARG